jgi:uncharacterized protein (TIGR02145 family)
MQGFTPQDCQALTTFTGSNQSDVVELKDTRDNQLYEVAKLADNRCWMIENLRLGSMNGTMQLTPQDTNISTDWTLPQLMTTSAPYSYTDPQIHKGVGANVNADSGGLPGTNNYGYLYNFCASSAGGLASDGSDTCRATGTQLATNDICATGWRLPTYANGSGEFSALDIAFGGSGGDQSGTPPHLSSWLYTGAFKSVNSSYQSNLGVGGGTTGYYRSQAASGILSVNSVAVRPYKGQTDSSSGVMRMAVRCILN